MVLITDWPSGLIRKRFISLVCLALCQILEFILLCNVPVRAVSGRLKLSRVNVSTVRHVRGKRHWKEVLFNSPIQEIPFFFICTSVDHIVKVR